jgi:hypothetical protein
MEVSDQYHAQAALPSGKRPSIPIGQEAEWAPEPVWNCGKEKVPVSAGNSNPYSPIIQLIA